MKRLLILIAVLLPSAINAQTAADLFTKMLTAMKAHQSLSYTADLRVVYAGAMDTSRTKALVHLLREQRDTLWGGMFWIGEDAKKETYSFYNLSSTYTVMSQIRRAKKETPLKGNVGLSIVYRSVLLYPFLQPGQMSPDRFTMSQSADATVSGKPCYVLKLEGKRLPDGQVSIQTFYLDKTDYFPLMILEQVPFSNNSYQYNILRLSNHEYDRASAAQFAAVQIPAGYTIDEREKKVPQIDPKEQVRPANQWPLPGSRRQ
jgi:outer membrane lipoprotein-sorting protein